MRTMIDALAPGAVVCLGPERDPIRGIVLAVTVRGGSVRRDVVGYAIQYQVAWHEGTTRHVEWLDACEVWVPTDRPETRLIGFAWGGDQ